jgi:hypothetical protein
MKRTAYLALIFFQMLNCGTDTSVFNQLGNNITIVILPPETICDDCLQFLVPFALEKLGRDNHKLVVTDYVVNYGLNEVFPSESIVPLNLENHRRYFLPNKNFGVWVKGDKGWRLISEDELAKYVSLD